MLTQPNKTIPKTIPAAVVLNKSKPDIRLNGVLAVLLVVTIFSILGGGGHGHGRSGWGVIHCLAGALLFVGCAIHLALHGRWIKAVVLSTPQNPTPAIRRNRRLFFALLVSLLVCGLSGPATLVFSHGPAHLLLPMLCFLPMIHDLSGVIFLGLSLYHLVLHRKWIMKKISERTMLDPEDPKGSKRG